MVKEHLWELDEALALARRLERRFRQRGFGSWHVALTGSVLYRGYSNKDLDLVVYPNQSGNYKTSMREVLEAAGLHQVRTRAWMLRNWAKRGITDRKWVEIWATKDGRRIDVMVLS